MLRPARREPAGRGAPRVRSSVARRLAWREIWAHPLRSLVIALLIALPVLGVSAGAIVLASGVPTASERLTRELGAAQLKLNWAGGEPCLQDPTSAQLACQSDQPLTVKNPPRSLVDAVAPGRAVVPIGTAETTIARTLAGGRELRAPVPVTTVDLTHPALAGRWDVVTGTAATGNAVMISRPLAEARHLAPGDAVATDRGSFVVAGVLASPLLDDGRLFVAPDHPLAGGAHVDEVLAVDGPALSPTDVEALNRRGLVAFDRSLLQVDRQADGTAAALVGQTVTFGGLAAILVVFVAGSAFAIGVASSRRQLGLLGAIGADARVLRRTVTWNAAFLAGIGAALGVVLGLGVAAPLVRFLAGGDRGWPIWGWHVPWFGLLAAALLGLGSGLAAAFLPARSVTKIDALEAVRSAEAPDDPARFPVLGLLLLAGGGGLLYAALAVLRQAGQEPPETTRHWLTPLGQALLLAGVVALVLGSLRCLGGVLTLLARVAPRRPLAVRLALRDLDRHRSRAVPALGAILTATLLASLALTGANGLLASERNQKVWRVHPTHVLIGPAYGGDGAKPAPLPVDRLVEVAASVTHATIKPTRLRSAEGYLEPAPEHRCPGGGVTSISVDDWRCSVNATGQTRYPSLVIGGESELRLLLGRAPSDAERAALASGAVLASARNAVSGGKVWLASFETEVGQARPVRGLSVDVPDDVTGWAIMSPARASELRLKESEPSLILDAGRRLTPDELDVLEAEFKALKLENHELPRDPHTPDPPVLWLLLAGAGFLVLVVTGLTTALAAAEAARDEATLAALGAPSRLRKATTAAQAGLVALLGCLAGVAVALVVLAALRSRDAYTAAVLAPPWAFLALLVVGIPAVGAALAYLVTPASKVVPRRQE